MYTIQSNTAFSFERFKALMRADLSANKSNYIKLAIGTIGVFTAIAILISIFTVMHINDLRQAAVTPGSILESAIPSRQNTGGMTYFTISIWVICVLTTVFGSLTFSNLSSKRGRISSFMIPASRFEKFILRLSTHLAGGILLLIVGFLIGMLICQIAFGGGGAICNELHSFFAQDYSGYMTTALALMTLLGNSIYALGSALWPKLSWIKTWVVVLIVQWLGFLLLIMLSTANISWYAFFTFCDQNVGLFRWGGMTLLTLLNVACWILAWWRYKNTQIIQRFMTK